jgi:ketosteroid isomerase-like protein
MRQRLNYILIGLASMFVAVGALAAEPKEFDPKEIRVATTRLIAALEDPDPTAWVYMYTEDAGLLEAGSEPLEGRAKLLELAHSMPPMSSVTITPTRTEGHGTIAYMYGSASWVNGRPPQAGSTSRVHVVIVWRKESDGQWRVAQEALVPDK